ncbi:Transcription elongation factor GreA [uncultured delta proteobacterium]|uniref:Transcription elongation factor GreA n=1 Tax=uncultured delta proteobacterium TaxID=34034 RepID=A0A212IVC6_9DELT|nr:Transcription elongation factor GreA [uncultured delta proteobacterium]
MENIPISVQGLALVKAELDRLKKARPEVIQAIKEAREEGDLSENAGYHAARERQGMLEAKITYIESRMPRFTVVDLATVSADTVVYGATVTLEDIESGETKKYTVLGPDETDYVKGSISVFSPVGRALIGRGEGDEITVEAPRGKLSYEIISVEYQDPSCYFPAPEEE